MRDKRSSKPNGLGYITWSNPPGLLSKEEGDGTCMCQRLSCVLEGGSKSGIDTSNEFMSRNYQHF